MLSTLHLWLPAYLGQVLRRQSGFARPTHVFFCLVDHFEPLWKQASRLQGLERVESWFEKYPRMADQFRDADGRCPQHTFFYPAEEYQASYLDLLARLCAAGYGEVEVHLHHDRDTADQLTRTLNQFTSMLRSHGLLSSDPTGQLRYAFIHGNWALDNSRRDGRWCGVNNELQVLRATGCYADFTLPSAPSDTQTRTINSLYYATDDPLRPKSHDRGIPVARSRPSTGDLLIVQGPLALNWRHRKWGLLPRLENAEISGDAPVTPSRIDNWVRQRIGVRGKPSWVFLKVHTHGCQERCADAVLGDGARRMHRWLQQQCNDGRNFILHYVTARELYNLVRAAEADHDDEPAALRNFVLPPPPIRS